MATNKPSTLSVYDKYTCKQLLVFQKNTLLYKMIKNIYALDNRTIPISPGRGKSAPFVSRFIFHKQMNIIHIQIISNNCKIKTQRQNSNKIISAQQLLSFQVSDSKNNQPFTASGRLSRSSLVNLAPSSTSAPSLAILLAITGALPPKMDL